MPAGVYLAFQFGQPAARGWGIPMATDIAFVVGCLAVLGSRVPHNLRILLLSLAIVDDIGAIVVIAVFYSAGIDPSALLWIAVGFSGLFLLHAIGVRPGFFFAIPGIVLWAGMMKFGVHPTIAGVIIGLMTPVKPWYGKVGFLRAARRALDDFQVLLRRPEHDDDELLEPLGRLARAHKEALSPAKRIEAKLHPYVAFGIMPLFALANAGVSIGGVELGGTMSMGVFLGVMLGLVVGKPLGIVLLSWIFVRAGLARLPAGVSWLAMIGGGLLGGIGFTMALFIAGLALDASLLDPAKIGILIGSVIAGVAGFAFLYAELPPPGTGPLAREPGAAGEESR